MPATVPRSIINAFQHAHYNVFAPGNHFTAHIGKRCDALASLMADYGKNTVSILTAYNPDAKTGDIDQNRHAQQALFEEIHKLGAPCFSGQNRAANGDGPAEPTWVVLGLSREQAKNLAQRFRQLAFVFSDECAKPELVWTHVRM
ncbi:DUF3293 domain-containing protein [Candidimonas sp. SYP-B2681]|uniref:DUF3293 domain-containing protein n=1 Tax=Candidimonas sp. SYP-B2681 TaxID=2497686 RepID=UPI0013152197|nr:DUF3293 domain-containing protein [Candidimonas sp. SYP-B2681]